MNARFIHALAPFLLVASVALVGCPEEGGNGGGSDAGSDTGGPGTDTGGTVAPVACGSAISKANAPDAWAERFCETLFSCECPDHAGYATVEDCIATERANTEALIAQGDAAGLTYSGECMACVTSFFADDLACTGDLTIFASQCAKTSCGIFAGTGALGDTCTALGVSAGSCGQGLWCNPVSSRCEDFRCAGSGLPTSAGPGETCVMGEPGRETWLPCAPHDEYVCDVTGTRTCVEIPQLDEPCVFGRCAEGLVCHGTTPPDFTDSTCVPPLAENDLCYFPGTCAEGLFCSIPSGGGGGTCAPLAAVGEDCRQHEDCVSTYCEGMFTGGDGIGQCAELPGLGEECDAFCEPGLACAGMEFPQTCQEAGGEGQPCGVDREAMLTDLCDDDTLVCNGQTCVRPAAEGESCVATGGLCEPGLECGGTDGTCVLPDALICEVQ